MGEFQTRLIKAMKMRDLTQAELAQMTGMSKPRISQYVNGVYEAKQDALLKLSKALMVDVAWLMGYDVPMNSALEALAKTKIEDDKILDLYHQLNDDGKYEAQNFIQFLLSQDKYKKDAVSSDQTSTA